MNELEQTIENLQNVSGTGTQLVSLYIPPDTSLQSVQSQLQSEYSEAANIKSKETRKNVQSALQKLLNSIREYTEIPDNGLVMFSGKTEGDDDHITAVFEPPKTVQSSEYRCDSSFYTEPLEKMKESDSVYALIVIDKNGAQVGRLQGEYIEELKSFSSNVPGKHTKGGQSQPRFERVRVQLTEEFYKKVGEFVNQMFVDERHEINGVLLGGPSHTRQEFANLGVLHHELQDEIVSAVSMGDTTKNGLEELVKRSQDEIEKNEIIEAEKLVSRFFSMLNEEADLVEYGFENVIRSIRLGAADTVILSDEIAGEKASTVECEGGHLNVLQGTGVSVSNCGVCGGDVNISEKYVFKAIEDLSKQFGTDVKYVSDGFEKGKQFNKSFNGIGALLRFSIDNTMK